MAHQLDAEAVDVPVDDMDSAAAALDTLFGDDADDQRDDAGEEDQSDDQDDNDLDLSDDEDDGDDEPAQSAIEAPVSLTAEEKAKFAQLPPEAQRYVAELEGRRATQVQTATTKAAEAQRTAEQRAALADAEAKGIYAQKLKAFADNLAPQAPDQRLAYEDPTTYNALFAQYTAARAQHDEFVQQVQSLGQEAEQQMTEAEIAARDRELMAIPEVQNEETREAFFTRAIEAGKTLGLDMSKIGSATAGELKALRQVSDWKEKAEKYDSAMTRQMQRVREGKKPRSAKPNAAQPSSSERRGFREAKDRLRASGDVKDAAAAIARLG